MSACVIQTSPVEARCYDSDRNQFAYCIGGLEAGHVDNTYLLQLPAIAQRKYLKQPCMANYLLFTGRHV